MNTFSPVIEYENEAEIEAALAREAQRATQNPDLVSAAFVLGSVGEEAGFKTVGTRVFIATRPSPPKSPAKPCAGSCGRSIPILPNSTRHGTPPIARRDEVKLAKEFSAREAVKLDADGW